MPLVAPLYAFNQGEVSTGALGRTDIAKLRLAAQCQLNWAPSTLGPMMLRPGLIYIGEVLGDNPGKLLRFTFGTDDVALLELTALNLRVYQNEQLISRAAVTTTISDPFFSGSPGGAWSTSGTTANSTATVGGGVATLINGAQGALASLAQTLSVPAGSIGVEHGLRVVITNGPINIAVGSSAGASDLLNLTNLAAGTYSLAFTPTGSSAYLALTANDYSPTHTLTECQIESAGAVVLPTPWAASNLKNIRYDQSGDIIFVACSGIQQRTIARYAARGWGVAVYQVPDGPFLTVPSAPARLSNSSNHFNGTLTSDAKYFQPGHVGALFALLQSQTGTSILAAADTYTPAIQVEGVGSQRSYTWGVGGTYSGTLSFQRSFYGPLAGFSTVTVGSNGQTGGSVFSSSTGGSTGTPDLDNVTAWERVGFEAGNYTSGYATPSGGAYKGDVVYGIARVTSYVSPTLVDVEVTQVLPTINQATTNWLESMWSGLRGWPSAVAFFDGRLYWFDGTNLWGSAADNFYSYAVQDQFGNPLGDAGAIIEQFGSMAGDVANWALPLATLMVGRDGSVASVFSSVLGQVVTPSTITTKDVTSHGAAALPAVRIDLDGVYVEKAGRRVYGLTPMPNPTGYGVIDLTRLNLDIGLAAFVDIDVQRQPDTYVHLVQGNGQLAVLLVDKADEVICWWRMQTAGVIENVAVLPDPGFEDLVYCIVRRTINGVTRRFIERIAHRTSAIGGALNINVDAAFSYSGAAIKQAQASWLPNTALLVWADGAFIGTVTTDASGNFTLPDGNAHSSIAAGLGGTIVIGSTLSKLPSGGAPSQVFAGLSNTLSVPAAYNGCPAEVFADVGGTGKLVRMSPPNGPLTVANGLITLPNGWTASTIVACLGYVAPFVSSKLAYAQQPGTALLQKKKIDHVGLLLTTTHAQGVQFGQRLDALDALPLLEYDAAVGSNQVWPEYDAPLTELPGEWDSDARLCLLAQAPYPATVTAAVIGIDTKVKT